VPARKQHQRTQRQPNKSFVKQEEEDMPKMKTHSGAKKRFRVTGSGKIMHERAGKRHLLERKSSRLTRRLTGDVEAKKPNTFSAKRMLGLK
jgi:large subunit ribosomal protein L35